MKHHETALTFGGNVVYAAAVINQSQCINSQGKLKEVKQPLFWILRDSWTATAVTQYFVYCSHTCHSEHVWVLKVASISREI